MATIDGPDPPRAPGTREVAVVTPWYPTRELPFRGAFVRAMVEATAPGCDRMTLYHCDAWVATMSPRAARRVRRAQRRLTGHVAQTAGTAGGALLRYLPVPIPRGNGHAEIARHYAEALRVDLAGAPLPEPVVHAHVGLPGGWAALRNLRPDARLFVTEHATFLDQMLAEPDARAMYEQVLARCTRLFAVGEQLRAALCGIYPQHADRIGVIPNPVRFDDPRPGPVTELRRWLYVGSLTPRKHVTWLLEAFAECRASDPGLTLTLAGEGPLRTGLTARAAELGLAEAVTLAGAVPPDAALRLMREHDLLVHPSEYETFGMTIVEAIAAGMPVLVTRCGGPEQTLAGIERAAGEMVEVEDGTNALVAGYRRLRGRFPGDLDLPAARAHLAGSYGYGPVAAAHHRAWAGGPAAGAPVRGAVAGGVV